MSTENVFSQGYFGSPASVSSGPVLTPLPTSNGPPSQLPSFASVGGEPTNASSASHVWLRLAL
jgi:hypothetical protein